MLDLVSSQAFVLYNHLLNRHTLLLIAWIYMDLKLVYWHIKDVSLTTSARKGSLRVLCFKSHGAESSTPPAHWGTAFYLPEGALGGGLCPPNCSAECWEQTLYSWPSLLRSLKIFTVEKRQIVWSLGSATEGRAVYVFKSTGSEFPSKLRVQELLLQQSEKKTPDCSN